MKPLALLALPALFAASPAAAVCAAGAQYNFAFASQPATNLTYNRGTPYGYTASTSGGASQNFTVAIAQNGLSSNIVNTTGTNVVLPAIGTLITGADGRRDLVLGGVFSGRTPDVAGSSRVITVTFTFSTPIRDFAMTLHDIDYDYDQYRDWIQVTGAAGGVTYTPVMATPHGSNNQTGGSRTVSGSSAVLGPYSPYLSASQAAGVGASANNSDDGQIAVSFAQPVTSVTLKYGNSPYFSGEDSTGQQAIGIAGISFCPMPNVQVTKTSSPAAGAYGAYDLPGADQTYTLTVTNTGASPVDAGTIVLTDFLPAGVTFRNTALSGGQPYSLSAGSSGVTLPSSSVAYSSSPTGSAWTYTPAAGYDPQVKGVRFTPSGAMAANSSFSISFVARVN